MKRFARIAALALCAAACNQDPRTPLVVYSPHGRDMLQAFERAYETAHPDVDVQALDMGSQEILDRLRSEKANPQADVWFGAPSDMFVTAASEKLLDPVQPSWGAQVRGSGLADTQGAWWGTYLTPEVIAYNSAALSADQAPHDWDDLLDPRWTGKVLIRDPLASGTMRAIWAMILERSLRSTGSTDAGFAWLRRLDAQTKEYVLNPTLLYQKLARQEGLVTVWDQPDIDILKSKGSYPIDYVIPTSGTPLVVDAVAVVRGAPHAAAARDFVEYVGGAPAILMAARQFHRIPARSDIAADSLPPALRRAREQLKPEPMDWQRVQTHISDWMRTWDETVRNRG